MKRTALASILILGLLFSVLVGTQFIGLGKANPLPNMYVKATIKNPKNTTYTTNTVTLKFSAESQSFFPYLNFSYSLDAQEAKPVQSITVTGHEFIPINPGIYRQWIQGSCVLSNLSEGWHNVTVYVTYALSREWLSYGGPTKLANITFWIALPQLHEQEPFQTNPAATASGLSIAAVGIGLLVYFKKRKR